MIRRVLLNFISDEFKNPKTRLGAISYCGTQVLSKVSTIETQLDYLIGLGVINCNKSGKLSVA